MFDILKKFFNNTLLYKNIALKGGTLSYFLYGLDRFSTDLDFDIVGDIDQEVIYNEVKKILLLIGEIKEEYNKRYTIFFLFSYGQFEMNIKIELNKRIWNSNKYIIQNFFGTDILTMDKSSVFANKLIALTDRERIANRDIYDIYYFYNDKFPINKDVIKERTGKNYIEYLIYIKEFLLKHQGRNLLDGLGEVLNEKQKFFVKNKLFKELMGFIDFEIKFN